MNTVPILPAYGRESLAELLVSVEACLSDESSNLLDLPQADRYVVLMVDGLGWQALHAVLPHLGYFPELLGDARLLTCAVPSTTATSLTTLGTGRVPGSHGIVGYRFRITEQAFLHALHWDENPDPKSVQPYATVFERCTSRGIAVSTVSPARFESSGLTTAGLRGSQFIGVNDENDVDHRIHLTVQASRQGKRSLVYAYERRLDHIGHGHGWQSDAWLKAAIWVDRLIERLREALDPDVVLLITGDHGMVDIPGRSRIVIDEHDILMRDVQMVAGEARMRHIYTDDPHGVAARWVDLLGERAWVCTADDAIAQGWFGPVEDRVHYRIGDVLVAMRDDWAALTMTSPGEMTLIGMHGSLTAAEMHVPLLIDQGWS